MMSLLWNKPRLVWLGVGLATVTLVIGRPQPLSFLVSADSLGPAAAPQAAAPVEIELVQTPGQFETKGLKLKPGNYVFKIVNRGIGHEVGFYLQEKDRNGRAVKGSDAGHVRDGETKKTKVVRLNRGTYVYSCPLNPTPHYTITVE